MARVEVKMNNAGIAKVYAQIAAKIERADTRFRGTHSGYPVHVVEADVRDAFAAIGVTLSDQQRREYAEAVSEGRPFTWKLR